MQPGSLTIAVLMDSMDWFTPGGPEAPAQVRAVNRSLWTADDRVARLAALFRLDPGLIARFHADRMGMIERRRVQKALAG